ncbi:MAG TPA: choice-of-anchor L domain-containing protein [Dehalococcoidia bacterium]|nr:choice-of-anchor L domain-containing protein [Dehalococcoidia bacterium]
MSQRRPFILAAAIGVAAVILCLTYPDAHSTPPALGAAPDCGDTSGRLVPNTDATVTLTPDRGEAGSSYTVAISGATANAFGPQPVDVIWDWDFSPVFTANAEGTIPTSATGTSFGATVPPFATPGFHTVTVCWLTSPLETWFFQMLTFEVIPIRSNCIETTDLAHGPTGATLAQQLLGGGITVSNVTFSGSNVAGGKFIDACNVIGFNSGIMLSSGDISGVIGPNIDDGISTINDRPGDADLTALAGFPTNDAAVLEFDFVPAGGSVTFNYVFASDEYNEFVNTDFNDVFAFFVNGTNCATVSGAPVSINTINNGNPFGSAPKSNPQLYRNNDINDGGSLDTEMDGLTTVLTCEANVLAGKKNHMKLAIADGSDSILDANVFLQAGSFVAATPTPSPTQTPTPPPTPTPAPTPSSTPTPSPTPSPTPVITPSPSPSPSPTPPPTPTSTPTPTPAPTPTPTTTPAPTPTPTAAPTATPTPTPVIGTAASSTPVPAPTSTPPRGASAPNATPAPTPTPSPTPIPSPTRTPSITPAPSPTALGAAQPPKSGGATDSSTIVSGSTGPRPEIVQSLIIPRKMSDDINVIGTNVILAGVTMITILLTATLFNQTVQENSDTIEGFLGRAVSPFRAIGHALSGIFNTATGNGGGFAGVFAPISILGLTALVYGFAEPGFGFNNKSLVLVASLIFGVGAVTYTYSGSQALLCSRGHGVASGVKLFPVGLMVAVAAVIVSRVEDFQPGIIYGFIASFAVFGAVTLDRRQMGQLVFIPGTILLAVCVLAWFLVDPFREFAQDHRGSWLAAVPEGITAAIFVGGLEGLFFNMIPLEFMDGKKLWEWNKAAWVAMAGVSAFLFWHVLLNTESSYFSALQKTTPLTAVLLIGICLTVTVSVWAFFKLRHVRGDFAR